VQELIDYRDYYEVDCVTRRGVCDSVVILNDLNDSASVDLMLLCFFMFMRCVLFSF